jgi:dihydrofolate reductase/thymidylate synthase
MNFCKTIYLTEINKDFECDVNVNLNLTNYDKTIISSHYINDINYEFTKYDYVNREEQQYLNIAKYILDHGNKRQTRNAITYSSFGKSIEFDLENGFPLLTTKKMFVRGIFEELLFFLRGDTNTKILEDKKVKIWSGNTSKKFIEDNNKNLQEYEMGPMYGYQWRQYNAKYNGSQYDYSNEGIDQLKNVIDLLINDPTSRRILMTTYNVEQTELGVLYPCHGLMTQFYVENNRISLQTYQRSADWALGVPFNIASYAAMLHIIVNLVNNIGEKNYSVGRIIIVFGDCHIYLDDNESHIEGIKEQIKRDAFPFCNFKLNKKLKSLDDLNTLDVKDMVITNYQCHKRIKMGMIA